MTVKGIVSVGGFSGWRTFEKLLNFGKMIVKLLKCRWLISPKYGTFFNLQKTLKCLEMRAKV